MPRFNLRLPFSISVSLKRCTPPHPVRLAAVLVFFTLVWQAVLLGLEALFGVHIGDTPFSELVLIAVIAGVCAAICRETWSAYLAFLTSGFLSSQLAPWAGLLPVAVVALHRLNVALRGRRAPLAPHAHGSVALDARQGAAVPARRAAAAEFLADRPGAP
jgi:hypothetical protein